MGLWLLMMAFGYGISTAQVAATTLQTKKTTKPRLVNVHFKKIPLPKALKAIAQKANAGISFKTDDVPSSPVTYQAKNESVYHVLDDVLEGTDLYYTLSDNKRVILIKQKLSKMVVRQNTVSGTVTDAATGKTISGVNILIVGTSTGAATDADGHYSLDVSSLQDTLRFSYIGYQTKKVPINGRASIDVAMKSATKALNQLVVVGFGKQTRKNIVGSVSSVDVESMQKVQASTFNQKLEGKVSGVNVTTSSGRLGAPVKINIRGTSSINASSQPLYVIDGVPLVNTSIGQGGNTGSVNGPVNPFINLSSDNIKSIEVLKDASAAAIYGTRGANGVVLITTKSGAAGNSKLNISVSGGVSRPTNKMNLLNGPEYIKVFNYRNGTNYKASDYANTDWQDAITHTGGFEKYHASISGGSKNNTYYIAGNYKNANGFLVGNSLKKFNAYIKVSHDFNKRLNVELTINPSVTYNNSLRGFGQVGAPFGFAVLEPPVVPIYAPDGSLNDGRESDVKANSNFSPFAGTPYTNVKNINLDNETKQTLTHLVVKYDLLANLTLKSNFGYQFLDNSLTNRDLDNTVSGYPNGQVGVSTHSFTNANWNNTLTYRKDWGNNSLNITLGATIEKTIAKNASVTKSNIPVNSLKDLNSASEIIDGSGANTSYTFQNNVLRISYNYKERYLLTLTGSYDGTSRFSKGNRYGFFPAAAAGWIISDENFMKNSGTFLKLRASYGVVGNANIGNFAYQPLLSANISYFNEPGLQFSQLANLGLTWETGNEFDVAIDYGFLNNRINGTLDYYNKLTTNLLLQRQVSDFNGFTSIFKNGGKMTNRGIEFNFNADIVRKNNFQWSINGNIATLHNEVKNLPGGQIIGGSNIVREGEAIASFYMPVYKGVDPNNGDALFDDGNGGTTSNYSKAPRKIVGTPQPDFYGGFGTNISYKGLDFSINFNYTYGNKLYWSGAEYLIGGSSIYNQYGTVINFWTPQNRRTNIPEPRLAPNGANTSTRYLEDGSYLRLKSVQIGYTFQTDLIGIKNIRLYFSGTNLMTITSFPGLDPEAKLNNVDNSNITQGVISGNDPQSLTISGGIQINM